VTLRVAVVGDTTWDVTVRATTRPVPGTDGPARITAGPGGQGANLGVRLARRGATVRLVTGIGTDATGILLATALAQEGVEVIDLGAPASGQVLALVDESGERAMLSDRARLDLTGDGMARADAALADADWIHLSGYPLADPASAAELATLAGERGAAQRCSVGGGSFAQGSLIGPTVRAARPDVVLFDRAEAAAVLDTGAGTAEVPSADLLATSLAGSLEVVAVVTDGPAGAAAATINGSIRVNAPAARLVDATGAGDAHAAVVILGLAGAPWPPSLEELRAVLADAGTAGAAVAGLVGAQARIPAEGDA
jgi:sugar/nucleoside kinase (ribokinase family)